jgi:Asp-tRNA(Asn)/Glu-tRNA(Gln) amidotransferase A subunit family amidase
LTYCTQFNGQLYHAKHKLAYRYRYSNWTQDGTISLPQILKDHHTRYEERDGDVHAWVVTRHLPLLSEAEALRADEGEQGDDMLLRGVTVGVKDIMSESLGLLL